MEMKPILNNLGNLGAKAKDSKQVAKYNKSGELICVYGSASEAGRKNNTSQGRISCNCRGESKTCKGHIYKYIPRKKYLNMIKEEKGGKRYAQYELI